MDNNEQKKPAQLPKWVMVFLILSLLFNGAVYLKLEAAERETTNLMSSIRNIEGSVNNTVSSSINQINQLLQKEASLISEFRHELGEYKGKRIEVTLSTKPKTYTEGEKIYFLYKTGENSPVLAQAKTKDNIVFSAKVDMSIFDSMEVDLIIDNGTTRKVERLPGIYRPADEFTARLNPRAVGGSIGYDKQKEALITTYEFEVLDHGKQMGYKLMDVKLEIRLNEEIIEEIPMEKIYSDEHLDRYTTQLEDYSIPCKDDDTVNIYITAKDNQGFNYRSNVGRWNIDQGRITESAQFRDIGEIEVY